MRSCNNLRNKMGIILSKYFKQYQTNPDNKMKKRKWSEFIVWNHIFMFYESIRMANLKNGYLSILGFITTILSTLYHRNHESTLYQPYEYIFAMSTMLSFPILTIKKAISMKCKKGDIWAKIRYILLFEIISIGLLIYSRKTCHCIVDDQNYYVVDTHYNKWHPWLHLSSAMAAHIFIDNLE